MYLEQRANRYMLSDEVTARELLLPGMELYGYLHGIFGRDSYGIKTIVKVNRFPDGKYQIVATDEEGVTNVSFDIGPGTSHTFLSIVDSSNRDCKECSERTAIENG